MARITSIKPRGRSRDRFVVSLDDKAFAILGPDELLRHALHVDDELDEAAQAAVLVSAARLGAYDRAVRMLASRGRSQAGLLRKLVEKGEARVYAAEAVERLAGQGLLDDASFARQLVRSKASSFGRARLALELSRQGVEREVAREALDEVLADPALDATDTLDRFVARKLKALERFDEVTRRRRLLGACARRGFSTSATLAALARQREGT